MGVANVPAASASGLQPKYQKFTSSGTFTLPTGYGAAKPLLIDIQVIGGGGGGNGMRGTSNGVVTAFNWTGNYNGYFGNGNTVNLTFNASTATGTYDAANTGGQNGAGGGSGGLAKTQMYLTSNLTITVGAAGARANIATDNTNLSPNSFFNSGNSGSQLNPYNNSGDNNLQNQGNNSFTWYRNFPLSAGGTGGTSTAGSVSAAGGAGANATNATIISNAYTVNGHRNTNGTTNTNVTHTTISADGNATAGAGGTPSGTAGGATPLLGTLAGGSGSSTAVFGSFGIGGIKTDGATSTGVEGTGGGANSIGASGAVIITWWE